MVLLPRQLTDKDKIKYDSNPVYHKTPINPSSSIYYDTESVGVHDRAPKSHVFYHILTVEKSIHDCFCIIWSKQYMI